MRPTRSARAGVACGPADDPRAPERSLTSLRARNRATARERPTSHAGRRMGAIGRNRKPIVNTILIRVPLNTNKCVCTDRVSYYKRCRCTNTGASRFSQAASPLRHAPRHALPLHGVVHPPDPPAPSLSPPQMRNSSAKAAHASCQLPSRLRCMPGQKPKKGPSVYCQARAALIDAGHCG